MVQVDDKIVVRFWSYVDKSGDCWLWTRGVTRGGYGSYGPTRGVKVYCHRFAYELAKGSIPDGYQVDHLCRDRKCVNPAHLEAVTQQENIQRQFAARGMCKRGHPVEPGNVKVNSQGANLCATCVSESQERRIAKLAAYRKRKQLVERLERVARDGLFADSIRRDCRNLLDRLDQPDVYAQGVA